MAHITSSRPRPDVADVTALLLVLLALAFRLYALGDPSLSFYDELTTLLRSLEPTAGGVVAAAARQYPPFIDFQPPLYYLVVHAAIALGHTDFLARLPAALSGAATAGLLYLVGRRLCGRSCGLFAAAALAVNLHHIDASQQVRLYAFFGCVSLAAVWALLRALASGRWRDWGLFALCAGLGLYTSYLAAATLLAAGLLVLLALVWPGDRAAPRRATLLGFPAALAACALAFWPWYAATAGIRAYLLTAATPQRPPLAEAATAMLGEFSSHYAAFLGRPELPWLLGTAALLGLAAGLCGPRRRGAVAAMIWLAAGFAPVWLRADTAHHFQVRYLLPCLFPLLLLAGCAAASLADVAGRLLPGRGGRAAPPILAALLGLALALPGLSAYPFFYRRDDSRLKTLAASLREQAGPGTALALWAEGGPWTRPYFEAFWAWYLPDVLDAVEPDDDRAYRACLLLAPEGAGTPPPAAATPLTRLARVGVYRLPLASHAPILPELDNDGTAAFTAAFALPDAFGQVYSSRNIRFAGDALILADRSRPGEVVYAFAALAGQTVSLAGLDFAATVAAYPGQPPTGRVLALAGSTPDPETPYTPASPPAPAKTLFLRVVLNPGPDREPVSLTRLSARLRVAGRADSGVTAETVRRQRLEANTRIVPFAPATLFPGGRPLAATPADTAARACPQTPPVVAIGQTAYLDPALCPAGLRLTPGQSLTLANPDPAPRSLASLAVAGDIGGATCTLGQTRFQIPLAGSPLLAAILVPEAAGTASLTPLFTDEGFAPDAAEASGTSAVKLPGQPVLSCPDAKPCRVTYAVTTGYPARALTLVWFPRLFADPAGRNAVTASFSTDGSRFTPLDAFQSTGSGLWEGLGVRRQADIALEGFTGTLLVRFDLSGDAAQLWSSPETPLSMTLDLDTRSLPPLVLQPGQTSLGVDCPADCAMAVSPDTVKP